jgi:DNA-binding CsgD family transcriptional regulator
MLADDPDSHWATFVVGPPPVADVVAALPYQRPGSAALLRENRCGVVAIDELERGREAYRRRAWLTAYKSLSLADEAAPLGAGDLELLATSAYLIGRSDDSGRALDRAHHGYLDAGEPVCAARCAVWLGFGLVDAGEMSRATGWFSRAQRLLERVERDCAERGYLLVPVMLQQLCPGTYETGYATAAVVAEIGERFGDVDLITFARQAQGRALVRLGRIKEGLTLLDEAMVAVVADELSSPLFTGLIYCSVIEACQEVYELPRAREWTAALTRWCEAQPDMLNFTGQCLVHRAEIMQLHGAWRDAREEARCASERFARGVNQLATGAAAYRHGEAHRLLGEFAAAEDAYRSASQWGWQPQPGLALLRLAQRRPDAAAAGICRMVGETTERLERARLLPAYVEIMLATGETAQARDACRELTEIAEGYGRDGVLGAIAAHARGAVELAEGDAPAALIALRHACQVWQQVGAPYEVARGRVLVGLACRALADDDGAELELAAARSAFEQLGATPDLAQLDSLTRGTPTENRRGLTPRELQILRLVAAGDTNKAIAARLVLSDRTVDRHVSNILTKLAVPSRAAATAYAYQHQLV